MSSDTILQVSGLRVSRGGIPVLDIPELSVQKGEFLSVIGPNGTGKSTLLLSLAGLVKRQGGTLHFKGKAVDNGSELLAFRRRLAMVFQEPLLFDSTVYENVAAGLKIRRMDRAQVKPVVEENLELFGISHLSTRSACKISGGEAQRTSLARAFATDPELIFLDEPFASLDPPTKEAIIAREHDSHIQPTIFYNDIRAFGKGFEDLFRRSKGLGIRFIRGLPGAVKQDGFLLFRQ